MSGFRSSLYEGRVMHRRLRPFGHRFDYRVFSLYLDLDELEALDRQLPLFGHNRFQLFSFHDKDHGDRDGQPLKPWIEAELAKAGIELEGGKIYLHCFPRILGYVFNPLSTWFCYHRDGGLRAILYEVRNTFGDKHGYLIPVSGHQPGKPIVQSCAKTMHVSPFIGMDATYAFRVKEPDARLSILIREFLPEGETLIATHTGERKTLTGRGLAWVFLRYPLMTLKVIAAIHWQAWKLWRKGAKFNRRTPPPEAAVEVIESHLPQAAE